ncbi:MAG: GTPase Era [Clostridiales bacterium]|nr:GTPase Era [Clostridiales bacterium]
MDKYKSGFVTIMGRANVGKSTLMNRFVGQKVSIVTHKPQTTRRKIQATFTGEDFQVIFIDTPGFHEPKSKLGEYMIKSAERSLSGVDVILYLTDPYAKINADNAVILQKLENVKIPVILVINKIDTIRKPEILPIIDAYSSRREFNEIIPASALTGENAGVVFEAIKKYLPEGPMYFPANTLTDQPERLIAAEIIREKALITLQDEVPHGIAVDVTSMKIRDGKDFFDIEAVLYCERESQKGIVIGKNGMMLREIGRRARPEIERLLDARVHLSLWLKVKKDWRDNNVNMRRFGYDLGDI